MPQSQNPLNRLASWRSWLGQYGRFLSDEPQGQRDADRIRRHVFENYIEPARERDAESVDVLVRDVNAALGLNQAWPNICQALTRPKFLEMADVGPPKCIGAEQSSATIFRFTLAEAELDRGVLERLRQQFLIKHTDFQTFVQSGSYGPAEDDYKRALIARADGLMQEHRAADAADVGAALLDLVSGKGAAESNLLDWRIAKLVADVRRDEPGVIERAAGDLARGDDPTGAVARFVAEIWPLLVARAPAKPYAESRTIPTMIRGLVDPQRVLGIRSTPTDNAAKMLLGRVAFASQPLSEDELRSVMVLADGIFRVMRDQWGWAPRDFWDVQGFIWETCQKRLSTPSERAAPQPETERYMVQPTNLILFGPPGTGKTYATAYEAVRLCSGGAPADRADLMAEYARLAEAGRIEFVTFHQSCAYEEFVEGLRPVQSGDDGSAGFQLQPELGVFRRIARRAEMSTGSGGNGFVLGDRRVFKMSIGDASKAEWAWLFDEAIAEGYTYLGFSDIDWSDERFADRRAILSASNERGIGEGELTERHGPVKSPDLFRNELKSDDVIVVSKGLNLFRAIGVVEGDYEYAPRPDGRYSHRRKVRWLWHDDQGVPVSEINAKRFSIETIYPMRIADLNVAALERYANSQVGSGVGEPESFVLIIDEINRANISKVFGELITLLEPDKRLGAPNELTVRLPYSRDMFGVPANLHIVGTMNTADRSIALLDTALRRRFSFRELMPDPGLLPEELDGVPLRAMLRTINERIEYLFDREHQIGHAYFMGCESRADVDAVMRDKVIPLLQEYFYEDWAKVALVLGDANGAGRFLDRVALKAPPGLEDDGHSGERHRWSVRETFDEGAYTQFG